MGTTYEPDGWMAVVGTWGTHMDQATDYFLTGNSSVKFEDYVDATNRYMRSTSYPCQAGDLLAVEGWVRAESVAAGNDVWVIVNWWDNTSTWISNSDIHNAVCSAADTWERKFGVATAPSGAVTFTLEFGKVNQADVAKRFHAWFDSIVVTPLMPCFFAVLSSDQACTTGEKIGFDSEVYDYGGVYNNGATHYHFTAPRTGIYALAAGMEITDLTDGAYVRIYFKKDGTAWISGGRVVNGVSNGDPGSVVSVPAALLVAGEEITVHVDHDHGSSRNVVGGSTPFTWFCGAQVA